MQIHRKLGVPILESDIQCGVHRNMELLVVARWCYPILTLIWGKEGDNMGKPPQCGVGEIIDLLVKLGAKGFTKLKSMKTLNSFNIKVNICH